MNMTPLPVIVKNCGMEIEELLPYVVNNDVSLNEILFFCTMFRRKGIAHHFSTCRTDIFFSDLFNSGRAYLFFLQNCDDDKKSTGKSFPVFDAIACNDFEGAGLIAEYSRMTVNEKKEYEEDFLYYKVLMDIFFMGASDDAIKNDLNRYETLLAGDTDLRFSLCNALFEKDQSAFNDRITLFLEEIEEENSKSTSNESIDPDHAASTAKLSVEGLALVLLAEKRGLQVSKDYLYIPSTVIRFNSIQHPEPDEWKKTVSYRHL